MERVSLEVDRERRLTAEQVDQDNDVGVQQKVAGAMVQQHVLSPNWSQRHKIYPTVERDQLMELLEGTLRRLHLMDLRTASDDVSATLKDAGLSLEVERDLRAHKVHLATQIRDTLAHFGTVILT